MRNADAKENFAADEESDSRALFTRRGAEDAGQLASIEDIEGLINGQHFAANTEDQG